MELTDESMDRMRLHNTCHRQNPIQLSKNKLFKLPRSGLVQHKIVRILNHFFAKIKGRIKLFFSQFYGVPYCVPAWGWAEHWAILKCLLTGQLIEGSHKERLFDMIKRKTGAKYVFGFNSGQEAIHAALKARGVGPNDKVIMPSYCCETVAKAVQDTGSHLLFCDINDDYNPDIDDILRLLDPSVRAVIVPHLFGNPADIDKLEKALEERGIRSKIFIIDDAAQSFGARLHGRLVGTFGDAGIISFGPGKTMTATGGGLLITNSKHLAQNLKRIPTSPVSYFTKLKHLTYWLIFRRWRKFTLPFYSFIKKLFVVCDHERSDLRKLCNADAAIASEQMKKLDSFIETRIKRKEILDNYLAESNSSIFLSLAKNFSDNASLNVATKYPVRIDIPKHSKDIFDFINKFIEASRIEIQTLYTPIHFKKDYSKRDIRLPKTEMYYNRIFQIPVEPSITNQKFDLILNRFGLLMDSVSKKVQDHIKG